MENVITDILKSQIKKAFAEKAGQATNLDTEKSDSLINAALPLIMGALAKNTTDAKGAEELDQALVKDHDGSILDHLDDLFDNPDNAEGAGILGHLFGENQSRIEELMAKEVGTKPDEASNMLKLLAPIVMGALGKAKNEQGLDSSGIASLIQNSLKGISSGESIPMDVVKNFLDSDKDGKVSDDLIAMGMRFIKKRFGGK